MKKQKVHHSIQKISQLLNSKLIIIATVKQLTKIKGGFIIVDDIDGI